MRTFYITWSGKVNWSTVRTLPDACACCNDTLILCTVTKYIQLKLKSGIIKVPGSRGILPIFAIGASKVVTNQQTICFPLINSTPSELC